MILKSTQLARERRTLPDVEPIPRPLRAELQSVASEERTEQRGDGFRILESTLAAPVATSVERELTFEMVVSWLALQDEPTRKACAAILSGEVTQVFEEARVNGVEQGRKEGAAAARMDVEAQLELLRDVTEAAESAFAQEQSQLEKICVEVVTEAFGKIAGPLLRSEAAAIGAVQEVLKRVRDEREIVIRVSRGDVPALQRNQGELTDALAGRRFQILADNRVELGGCIVESRLGNFDGRFEVQLRELYETLRLARAAQPETA